MYKVIRITKDGCCQKRGRIREEELEEESRNETNVGDFRHRLPLKWQLMLMF